MSWARLVPALLGLSSLSLASPVHADQVDRPLRQSDVTAVYLWAKCYARHPKADALISRYSFENGFGQIVAESEAHLCLAQIRSSGTLSASAVQMAGAIYIHRLRALPAFAPLVPVDGPRYDGGARSAIDPEAQKLISQYYEAAECVVRRAPMDSYELAVGRETLRYQRTAFAKLVDHWKACSPPKADIQPFTLQGLLAHTIVRLKGFQPSLRAGA